MPQVFYMWIILYIYFFFLILSVFFWAYKYGDLKISLRIAGFTALATLLVDVYAAYLLSHDTNNNYLYHILIPIQYVLLSLMFYKELSAPIVRKSILSTLPIFIFAVVFITLRLQSIIEYSSYTRVLKNVLLACWCLLYYREVFLGLRINRLETEPMFWISTGLFFYSLGNVFVDGLMNYLLEQSRGWAKPIYYVNIFLGILLNITFLVSFLLSKKRQLPS